MTQMQPASCRALTVSERQMGKLRLNKAQSREQGVTQTTQKRGLETPYQCSSQCSMKGQAGPPGSLFPLLWDTPGGDLDTRPACGQASPLAPALCTRLSSRWQQRPSCRASRPE